MKINDIDYYVPITSYKKSQQDNILIKIESHKKLVIKGSMRFNYMIAVPSGCLVPVDFSSDVFTHEDRIMLRIVVHSKS